MKISELILELEKIKEREGGDLPVYLTSYHSVNHEALKGIQLFFPEFLNSIDGVKVVIG
ncbi:MAG TPA: hypothetical protein VIJ14_05165 [Rhabdochlamydiaceae bacterium]